MLEYALESGIPLSDNALNRTDDIERYLIIVSNIKNAVSAAEMERSITQMRLEWDVIGSR